MSVNATNQNLSGFSFGLLNGCELAVEVRSEAESARIQFATLSDSGATGGARHGGYLFGSEFVLFHAGKIVERATANLFNIARVSKHPVRQAQTTVRPIFIRRL